MTVIRGWFYLRSSSSHLSVTDGCVCSAVIESYSKAAWDIWPFGILPIMDKVYPVYMGKLFERELTWIYASAYKCTKEFDQSFW